MRAFVSLAVTVRDDEEEDKEEEEEPPPRAWNPRKDKMHRRFLKTAVKREIKKISVKQRCAIFFRTSGGTGLPAIAFDKTRDRINFGVFLARIFDVTTAFDCVWIIAPALELANIFYRVPVDDGNAVSYFFLEGVSFDGWLFLPFAAFFFNKISSFLPPPSVLSHRHRSKFFTFSGTTFGLCEQKRDFDSFIHRSRISKRGRKISTHHPKKRALSSLLFSSLLSSLETQRRRRRRRKRCITDTHTNTPRAPC